MLGLVKKALNNKSDISVRRKNAESINQIQKSDYFIELHRYNNYGVEISELSYEEFLNLSNQG